MYEPIKELNDIIPMYKLYKNFIPKENYYINFMNIYKEIYLTIKLQNIMELINIIFFY